MLKYVIRFTNGQYNYGGFAVPDVQEASAYDSLTEALHYSKQLLNLDAILVQDSLLVVYSF